MTISWSRGSGVGTGMGSGSGSGTGTGRDGDGEGLGRGRGQDGLGRGRAERVRKPSSSAWTLINPVPSCALRLLRPRPARPGTCRTRLSLPVPRSRTGPRAGLLPQPRNPSRRPRKRGAADLRPPVSPAQVRTTTSSCSGPWTTPSCARTPSACTSGRPAAPREARAGHGHSGRAGPGCHGAGRVREAGPRPRRRRGDGLKGGREHRAARPGGPGPPPTRRTVHGGFPGPCV